MNFPQLLVFLGFGETDATADSDTIDVYNQSLELIFSGWSTPAPRVDPERQFCLIQRKAFISVRSLAHKKRIKGSLIKRSALLLLE
jgi:hypothetical protein